MEGSMTITSKSDATIQADVIQELAWDTRIGSTDVGVEVDNGVVTLTGTVSSWGKRVAAQIAAHRVAGVLDVANDLEVRLPGAAGRTDTEIAQAIRTALEWNVMVPDRRIRTTVTNGTVTLSGNVDYGSQREDAERCIRNLDGVRLVVNEITIRPERPIEADDIRRSVEDALERQAARRAGAIEIQVQDGRVVIDGIVHSCAERDAVIGAARGTPGVTAVASHLRVEPSTTCC
jgi:osmotically-inducible protein OsmY